MQWTKRLPCPTQWSMWPRLRRLTAVHGKLLDILIPASCALCGQRCAAAVCASCRQQFFSDTPHRCPRCADRTGDQLAHLCGRCLRAAPPFDATLVATDYAVPVDQLVLQLKFGSQLGLACLFADLLHETTLARPDFPLPDLICPVPLGHLRLIERGYNQALEIARPLSKLLGVPCLAELACRTRETRAQSRVSPGERRTNMKGAFLIAPTAWPLIAGRHIGVVDDVMTSGATLAELAVTLKRFGAARVSNLVFARTPAR